MVVNVYALDPLSDPRWGELVARHAKGGVFHTTAWLESLRRTYGYEPVAYTTSPPGTDLQNGLVFCRVNSWLSGRRLVSLPFSDHCEPLVDRSVDLQVLLAAIGRQYWNQRWCYVEIRALRSLGAGTSLFHSTYNYCFHKLDLKQDITTLFRNFHKSSTQRAIRRAEREGLTAQEGQSESLLNSFYDLFLLTRRRHRIPPQPLTWFHSLIDCFGQALQIRIAFKGGRPVAGMLTLRYNETLIYKYGCSDARFSNLGGMHLLFWRSIQEAKQENMCVFDLGRSDCENAGLITFKDRWGAMRSTLTYSRYTLSRQSAGTFKPAEAAWKLRVAKGLFAYAPDRLFSAAGRLLYKHIG